MQRKMYIISSCDDCPDCKYGWEYNELGVDDKVVVRCLKTKSVSGRNENRVVTDPKTFPEWCPLYDYGGCDCAEKTP